MAIGRRPQFLTTQAYCSHDMAAGFPRAGGGGGRRVRAKMGASTSYNLTSEVMCRHFCSMLLATKTNPDTMWEGLPKDVQTIRWGSVWTILEATEPR